MTHFNLKKLKHLFIFFLLFLLTHFTYSQTKTITGLVKDGLETPLIGAKVLIKGSNRGALTDEKGVFSLSIQGSDEALIVSYIGYESKEVPLTDQSNYIIVLEGDLSISEVVVTALGVKRDEKAL